MTDKKYFHHGTRKEWENKIVESFSVNLSKTNKILEYFWSWYSLPTEKKTVIGQTRKQFPFFIPPKEMDFWHKWKVPPFISKKVKLTLSYEFVTTPGN